MAAVFHTKGEKTGPKPPVAPQGHLRPLTATRTGGSNSSGAWKAETGVPAASALGTALSRAFPGPADTALSLWVLPQPRGGGGALVPPVRIPTSLIGAHPVTSLHPDCLLTAPSPDTGSRGSGPRMSSSGDGHAARAGLTSEGR